MNTFSTPNRLDLERAAVLRRRLEELATELGFAIGDIDTYEKRDPYDPVRIVIELFQGDKPQ